MSVDSSCEHSDRATSFHNSLVFDYTSYDVSLGVKYTPLRLSFVAKKLVFDSCRSWTTRMT